MAKWTFLALLPLLSGPILGQTEADKKILDMASEIEERVEEIRGLEFKRSVEKGIYTKDQLKEFLLEQLEKELPEEKRIGWEASLKLFGLIPEEMKFYEYLVEFLTSQVGGFYDPDIKRLNCITTKLSFLQHMIMAHEILHALQDQHMDLQQYYKVVDFNDDLYMARMSVIEGEAQHLTEAYMRVHVKEMAEDVGEMNPLDLGTLALTQYSASREAPPFLMESMAFPYLQGQQFIKAALREGGWPMVDALYRVPPRSTEQVIHPEKFFGELDDPVKIVLPGLEAILGGDCREIYQNSLGEFQVRLVLQFNGEPVRAVRAAAGWDGDQYALYREGEAGRVLMVWALTFDTERDGAEFFEAQVRGMDRKYTFRGGGMLPEGGLRAGNGKGAGDDDAEGAVRFSAKDGSMACMERRGRDVVVLDNFPPDSGGLLGRAREALWAFSREAYDFNRFRPVPYPDREDGQPGEGDR